MTPAGPDEVRVAVVGTGLAGLAVAHFLASADPTPTKRIHVELLERHTQLGMDAESISVEHGGETVRIDVPMRAFSKGTRVNLPRLLS